MYLKNVKERSFRSAGYILRIIAPSGDEAEWHGRAGHRTIPKSSLQSAIRTRRTTKSQCGDMAGGLD